jgi:hypothetical protein
VANLVVSNAGEQYLCDTLLRTALAVPQLWHVHLYENDYTPLANVALGDLTEVSLPGYTPQNIDRTQWPAAASVGGEARVTYGANPVTFNVSSGVVNVFGFFVTDESNAVLLWVERFDTYQVMDSLHPGRVILTFATRSQSEPV